MRVDSFLLNLTSEDPERLQKWYQDTLGLPPVEGMGPGALAAGGAVIVFDAHSETKGPAKEPQRYLMNYFVDDIAAEQARLVTAGVPMVREQGREWWGGVISTFLDPDGNYVQLIEYRPADVKAEATAEAHA